LWVTWRRGASKLGKDPQCVVPPSGRSPARRRQTLSCGVARSSQPCPPALLLQSGSCARTHGDVMMAARRTFQPETHMCTCVSETFVSALVGSSTQCPVASQVTEVGPRPAPCMCACGRGGASHGPSARRTPLGAARSTFMLTNTSFKYIHIHINTWRSSFDSWRSSSSIGPSKL